MKLQWFLGYPEKWFYPSGVGNILSLREVDTFFVIKYNHKEKKFVVHNKEEDNEEGNV